MRDEIQSTSYNAGYNAGYEAGKRMERVRCAAKCRAIAAENSEQSFLIGATALRCAEWIERGEE